MWGQFAVDVFAFGGYRSYNITWWFFRLIVVCYMLYPFVQRGVGRWPWLWLAAPLLLTSVFDPTGTFCREWILSRWLFVFLAGMFAYEICGRCGGRPGRGVAWRRWLVWLCGVAVCAVGFWVRERWGETVDGALAAGLVVALTPVLRHLGRARVVPEFLGRHSMNIFMVHSFICTYYFHDEIARIGNPFLRFGVLLGVSLAISMVVEQGKRFIRGRKKD